MALIKCPECGQQISDKAPACIHCGCPLTNENGINTSSKYNVVLISHGRNKLDAVRVLRELTGLTLKPALELAENTPSTIIESISKQEAENIQQKFLKVGATVEIEPTSNHQERHTTCPRCGSSAISTGQRGFNIVSGFWGSNKTANRCAKCGYQWEPRG